MVKLGLLELSAQLAEAQCAGVGTWHGQGLARRLLGIDHHHPGLAIVLVHHLPGQLQPGKQPHLTFRNDVEPQLASGQRIGAGEVELAPGLQCLDVLDQIVAPVGGRAQRVLVGEHLRQHVRHVELLFAAHLAALVRHVAEVAQGLARADRMLGRRGLGLARHGGEREQVQAAQRLQGVEDAFLLLQEPRQRELPQAHDAHAPTLRTYLRLAILERTTAARSASER